MTKGKTKRKAAVKAGRPTYSYGIFMIIGNDDTARSVSYGATYKTAKAARATYESSGYVTGQDYVVKRKAKGSRRWEATR